MPYEAKRDCFGYKAGRCTVLTELFCTKENCAFYKTKEQYDKDREKAEKNIGRQSK